MRSRHTGFEMTEDYRTSVACPACGRRFEIASTSYWTRRLAGESVAPMTRVFCSNRCRQKAYRRRAGSRT
jgi:endogenous inhibitor of DNA gyrase (YacG/DUF329 family)